MIVTVFDHRRGFNLFVSIQSTTLPFDRSIRTQCQKIFLSHLPNLQAFFECGEPPKNQASKMNLPWAVGKSSEIPYISHQNKEKLSRFNSKDCPILFYIYFPAVGFIKISTSTCRSQCTTPEVVSQKNGEINDAYGSNSHGNPIESPKIPLKTTFQRKIPFGKSHWKSHLVKSKKNMSRTISRKKKNLSG